MATTAINETNPTFADAMKLMDTSGAMIPIAEQLQRNIPELNDATVKEGNLLTGHRIAHETALPSVSWRTANQGVASSKSRVHQVDEACGQLAAKSVLDPDVANLGGNEQAVRAAYDSRFVRAMGHEVATGIWYHSRNTNPEKFDGMAMRLASTTGLYGGQVIDSQIAASGDDQASIYIMCWGPGGVYLIYPKGQTAGVKLTDMGLREATDADGNSFPAWVSYWKWQVGLCVEDYRQVVRLANIDTSAVAETGTLLLQDMLKAYFQIHNPSMGRMAMYLNRKIIAYLTSQSIFGAANSTLKYENDLATGQQVMTFMGIPVRVTDSLLNTESIVS